MSIRQIEIDPVAENGNFKSADRKGQWYCNIGAFKFEDPTNVGKGPCTIFEPAVFTQATETPWADVQWKAGLFRKFTGDPRDKGVSELIWDAPAEPAAEAPAQKLVPVYVEKPAAKK